MNLEKEIILLAKEAKEASDKIAAADTSIKNLALITIAEKIEKQADYIKAENKKDLIDAKKSGLSDAMIDRLAVTDKVIKSMSGGLREAASLEDPVGGITKTWKRPNGLEVSKMRIPIGVIGIIYESRPNVTIDAAGLCLKSGNAVILKGGSEAFNSNQALVKIFKEGLAETNLPIDAIQTLGSKDREAVTILLKQEEHIDLIIPRGGEGLIRYVVQNSKIPVLKHYKGVCHTFIDKSAEYQTAEKICLNAKVQRPGVCNAMETLLIHTDIADTFLPKLHSAFKKAKVEIRGCKKTASILPEIKSATEEDWHAEYLNLTLSVKIVNNIDEAILHIKKYGSNHSEAIITKNIQSARYFVKQVDSSGVFVNASTRFNDGGELGLGAEIGISTSKLHAFGPMGLEELTCEKFVIIGDGQIRE
ncbi:MAG: glutamate-5-semialdehyde dehydrogenase [Deltaproteobacteria bacterium]|nr:glutamate-5-semialdehyde dehydrogenase [Deltaproteobacteria bacterium]